jgi:hypothetical protein
MPDTVVVVRALVRACALSSTFGPGEQILQLLPGGTRVRDPANNRYQPVVADQVEPHRSGTGRRGHGLTRSGPAIRCCDVAGAVVEWHTAPAGHHADQQQSAATRAKPLPDTSRIRHPHRHGHIMRSRQPGSDHFRRCTGIVTRPS